MVRQQGLLGGDEPPAKKPRKATKAKEADGAVARLFDVYRDEFRRKWNRFAPDGTLIEPEVTPLIQYGRDGKSLKDMKDAWGEAAVADLIRDFFASTDPQVVRSDYKIQVLFREAQRLRLNAHGRNGHARDQRTLENMDAAARAARNRR